MIFTEPAKEILIIRDVDVVVAGGCVAQTCRASEIAVDGGKRFI